MEWTIRVAAIAVVIAAILAPTAGAQDPTVANVKLGTHVYGPELDPQDLQGRPVLLYTWDIT